MSAWPGAAPLPGTDSSGGSRPGCADPVGTSLALLDGRSIRAVTSSVVDVWMQHPTVRFLQQDAFASLRRWTGASIPEAEPPISASLQSMDAAGVGFGLLSAWSGPREGFLISDEEVAAWVAEHPDRFAGLAAVDLDEPMEAVRELRRCVTELGFKGLRIVPWLWQAPPTDRRYYPLYAACVELGVPFPLSGWRSGR